MDDPGEDGFMWSFGDEGHQSGALIIVCTEYSTEYVLFISSISIVA